jgi:hypothetical protein
VALEEHVGEHESCHSVAGVEANVFHAGATDRHLQRRSCDRVPGGERQAQLEEVDALQALEKDDDVVFVALGALGRRANEVVVEMERQKRRTVERVRDGISSLMRNVLKEQRGVVIPETELTKEVRRRGADDVVPFATYKRKCLPPESVASRFGKDICTIKSEDLEKDVVGELIYSRQW